MIVIFHLIYVMASSLISIVSHSMFTLPFTKSKQEDQGDEIGEPSKEDVTCLTTASAKAEAGTKGSYVHDTEPIEGLQFVPPVYAQRYVAVQKVLMDPRWSGNVKKVVDFGCAEFGFFTYAKHVPGVQEILTVDIDEELLKQCKCRVAPLVSDYLSNRETPLRVRVFAGSITHLDRCLLGTDAVVCIEIIEHLWPNEVEAVPYTVFGFIKPQVAIFTTPNSDFNVLFTNFTGFRHLDHKFEWSRDQFHCWASNIVSRYPDYDVTFQGIGAGPPGTETYGHCSQMAVFVKRGSSLILRSEEEGSDFFTQVCDYDFPFRVDGRTDDEKILHEAEYSIRLYGPNNDYCNDDGVTEVPICLLMPCVEKWCTSEEKLISILEGNNWKMSDRDPNKPAVIYPYFNDCGSSSEGNDYDDEDEPGHSATVLNVGETVCYDNDDWNDWGEEPEDFAEMLENNSDETDNPIIPSPGIVNGNVSYSSAVIPDQKLELNLMNMAVNSVDKANTCKKAKKWELNQSNIDSCLKVMDSSTDIAQTRDLVDTNGLECIAVDGSFCELASLSSSSSCLGKFAGGSKTSFGDGSRRSTCSQEMTDSLVVNFSESQNTIASGFSSGLATSSSSTSCMHKFPASQDFNTSSGHGSCLSIRSQEMTDSLVVNFSESQNTINDLDVDSSSDDYNYVDNSRSEQAMDLDLSPDHSDISLSDDSQGQVNIDNQAAHVNRVQQPHRNNFPFGLNDIAVENGDVANNNRDGEGNNAVAVLDEVIVVDLGLLDEDDEDLEEENEDEEDEDFENDNEPLLPPDDLVNHFPPWLLNLIQVVHHGGPEGGGAGEPNGHI